MSDECCVCEQEIEVEALTCAACQGAFTLPCGFKNVEANMGGEMKRVDVCDICWDETPQGPTNDYFTGISDDLEIL